MSCRALGCMCICENCKPKDRHTQPFHCWRHDAGCHVGCPIEYTKR